MTKSSQPPGSPVGEYPLPHTIGAHLPTPGKAPGWPMANIGEWRIDVQGSAAAWLAEMKAWRHEHWIRMGYDDAGYRRAEFQWAQKNFVHVQMMVEDRYFYDPAAGRYTVDRYLDDLERRFGGVDSVLIWYVYPNIGVDDRNQTALASDLPGGLEGLKGAIADFHRRGVKVLLPTMAWDNGTRGEGVPDWEAIARLAAAVAADGVNGDTYNGLPRAFRTASDAIGHALVFQPESIPYADEQLMWNHQSWGKASTGGIPAVSKLKWLEPRHLVNIENRWARDRTDDFHYMFFNGIGYVAWENIWGVWNQLTERDAEALRRLATLSRRCSALLASREWEPYAPTLQAGVFASRFPGAGATLWTLVNRNEYALSGEQLAVPHRDGRRCFDLWNGTPLAPRIADGRAHLDFGLEPRGYGAVLALEPGAEFAGLDEFLDRMRGLNSTPLSARSKEWRALPQRLLPVAPTRPAPKTPAGMVTIPAGEFDFVVGGIEIEGYTWAGLDFQYPWEDLPRRHHRHRMRLRSFHIDRYPVTNAEFARFLAGSGYKPRDAHHFLRHWQDGAPRPGWEKKPVTWVALEDARAYAAWAGKRLPEDWEWQYAAQGADGRLFPWGNEWNPLNVPPASRVREMPPPADVDAHPAGASPFAVMDMVGNVWQWTSEFEDEHTRAAALRGGSAWLPQTSHWYFPQAYRLDQHGKYLLMAPCKDRSGGIGFRCVIDAERI
ncbi:MAG: formylglycine-generating enzyme family protein [Gammaproteobacteria bacterium]